jgi:hypothetical protein
MAPACSTIFDLNGVVFFPKGAAGSVVLFLSGGDLAVQAAE